MLSGSARLCVLIEKLALPAGLQMESGMNKKPAILYISSADPTVRAGRWALDYFNAFRKAGYDVDLLTKYKVKNHPEIYSVFLFG